MSGKATLRAAIDDAVATKTKPAAAAVSPWPAIEEAFKRDLMEYGNQIKAKAYGGSYGQYLKIALLHLHEGAAVQFSDTGRRSPHRPWP